MKTLISSPRKLGSPAQTYSLFRLQVQVNSEQCCPGRGRMVPIAEDCIASKPSPVLECRVTGVVDDSYTASSRQLLLLECGMAEDGPKEELSPED